MSDITVVATVTPDVSSPTGFAWTYTATGNEGSFTILDNGTIEIPQGTSPEIMLNVVPGGQPSDTCVLQNNQLDPQQKPPLTFTDWQGNPVNNPLWYSGPTFVNPSTILFIDDNTNFRTRNYYIDVNVMYASGDVDIPTTSPDPTIVNVGTDGSGGMRIHFPGKASSQEQAKPTAVAG